MDSLPQICTFVDVWHTEVIPHAAIDSDSCFVVLDADGQILSEHDEPGAACRALISYFLETDHDGVMMLRGPEGWVEF